MKPPLVVRAMLLFGSMLLCMGCDDGDVDGSDSVEDLSTIDDALVNGMRFALAGETLTLTELFHPNCSDSWATRDDCPEVWDGTIAAFAVMNVEHILSQDGNTLTRKMDLDGDGSWDIEQVLTRTG